VWAGIYFDYFTPTHLFLQEFGSCVSQVLIDAVVHAVNEDYEEMAGDFIKLGFLPGRSKAVVFPPSTLKPIPKPLTPRLPMDGA